MALKLYHITTARRAASISRTGLRAPVFLSSWRYLHDWIGSYFLDKVETSSKDRFLVVYRVNVRRRDVVLNKESKIGELTVTEYASPKDIPPSKLRLVRRLRIPSLAEFKRDYNVIPGKSKKPRRVKRYPRKRRQYGVPGGLKFEDVFERKT